MCGSCLWKWWLSELFQKKGISMMSLLQTWLLKEISIDSHNNEMIITSIWSDIDLHYNTIDCQIDIIWNDITVLITYSLHRIQFFIFIQRQDTTMKSERDGFSYISFHSFLRFLQSTAVDSRLYCICLYVVLSSCILIPHGLIQSDQRDGNTMFLTLCPSSSPFLTPIRMISPVACYHIKGRIEQSEGGSMNGSCMCWDHSLEGLSLLTYTIEYVDILSSTPCILTLLVVVCNPVIIIISPMSIIPLSLHHFRTSFSYTNAVMR